MLTPEELERKFYDLHHEFREQEHKFEVHEHDTRHEINRLKITVLGGLSAGFFAIFLIFLTNLVSNYFGPF